MKFTARNKEETKEIAASLLEKITPQERAVVVTLQGELGAGKTNFAQAAGKLLGVKENMHSPTFVIMKIYGIDFKNFKHLIHIDAYRLEKEEELTHLGWEKIIASPENLVLIEWPERVPGLIPAQAIKVKFTWMSEGEREISFDFSQDEENG